jgi:hypothetical protein
MTQIFNGTIKDIKKIYSKEIDGKFYTIIRTELGLFYDNDCNFYPDREPYICDTKEQADDYCKMIMECMDAIDKPRRQL